MRKNAAALYFGLVLTGLTLAGAAADAPTDLRLVPYPKEVQREPGDFALQRGLVLTAPRKWLWLVGPMVREEFARAGLPQPALVAGKGCRNIVMLSAVTPPPRVDLALRKKASPEEYVLRIQPDAVSIKGDAATGLFYGVQTLCQLVRANRSRDRLPCLTIRDWPCSLRWRAYQDDLTRIPSSTFDTLCREVDLGAYFKLNVFTYYMESQFAFRKHPIIGPPDGSLTPQELKTLVAYARPRQVNILGNQQSFGHMDQVLKYDEYKALAETSWILNPTNEATYKFLNDLYSEVAPLLPFPYFNVCCDETQGLGKGPAKALVEQKGEGVVYARHIARIHGLIKRRYHKRMMMWGDIVLQHPETLELIPKDTIMLTWGYEPSDSYDGQILPFVKAGYAFMVCPSVRNFGRILPDFSGAVVNIQNFTRDGAKNGALGVINTAWDDGGRTLNAPNWHGYAWGAECAWNGGTTSIEAFNRRVGAVLFGETGDHFGRAIEALAGLQKIPLTAGGSDDRFWKDILSGEVKLTSVEQACVEAKEVLDIVSASRAGFLACRKEATSNADLLDYLLFGLKRYEVLGRSVLDLSDAAARYAEACQRPAKEAGALLGQCQSLLEKTSSGYRALQQEEWDLYLRENKPYGADFRYTAYQTKFIDRYEAIAARIQTTRPDAAAGKALPTPKEVGFNIASTEP